MKRRPDIAPVVVAHGGAGMIVVAEQRTHAAAVRNALVRGLDALATSAADAVVAAVEWMETAPILNAGRGASLDAEGRATLDAGFMEGKERRFGAVGCVTRTANPIALARRLSEEGDFGRLIVGAAADALVASFRLSACEPEDLITEASLRRWQRQPKPGRASAADTVGAVALDGRGRLAAAVSTGGLGLKPAGRVGDSAVVGAGFWAEQPLGACVTTGIGEAMLREGTARRCVRLLAEGLEPERAADVALGEVASDAQRPPCGLILVTADGRVAIAHTSPAMTAGYARASARAVVRSHW